LVIQASNNQKHDIKKRETRGFISTNNPNIYTFTSTFNLAEGQLFLNSLPIFYTGEGYKALGIQDKEYFVQGAITKTFTTIGRTLIFRDSGLPNSEAGFYQDSNSQVYITFTTSPPRCIPVTLGIYNDENNIGAFVILYAY
jgi:hypothetical protein